MKDLDINCKCDKHMISVIIPLYNKAPYVKKALKSIISQSYSDWAVIVIDDGSMADSYWVAGEDVSS